MRARFATTRELFRWLEGAGKRDTGRLDVALNDIEGLVASLLGRS